MRGNWKALAREAGFRVSPEGTICVALSQGRKQTISFTLNADETALRASTVIATARTVEFALEGLNAATGTALRYAWERNRLSDLFGFTYDQRGRLIGESWLPMDGLTAEEFGIYVRELARISDWHEFRLAGIDSY